MTFPAVTVCPLNRVHCHNLGEVLEANACPTGQTDCLITKYSVPLNYSDLVAFAKLTGCKMFGDDDDDDDDDDGTLAPITDVNGNEVDQAFDTENVFLQSYASLDKELREDIGYQFDDFIRGCTFKGYNCRQEMYMNKFK